MQVQKSRQVSSFNRRNPKCTSAICSQNRCVKNDLPIAMNTRHVDFHRMRSCIGKLGHRN
jgi:hypothetical protein